MHMGVEEQDLKKRGSCQLPVDGVERVAKRDKKYVGSEIVDEDPGVEQGLTSLLDDATGTNGDRSRQLAALIELERRTRLVKGFPRAHHLLNVFKEQLRESCSGDSHAQCVHISSVGISALEILACSKALYNTDATASICIATTVIKDLIETASTPRVPMRVIQRCLLSLLRIFQARPSVVRPGLGTLIAQTLRDGSSACRALSLELIAQSKVAVAGQDGRAVVCAFGRDASAHVRVAALRALHAWRPLPIETYPAITQSLADDNALVRKEAVLL